MSGLRGVVGAAIRFLVLNVVCGLLFVPSTATAAATAAWSDITDPVIRQAGKLGLAQYLNGVWGNNQSVPCGATCQMLEADLEIAAMVADDPIPAVSIAAGIDTGLGLKTPLKLPLSPSQLFQWVSPLDLLEFNYRVWRYTYQTFKGEKNIWVRHPAEPVSIANSYWHWYDGNPNTNLFTTYAEQTKGPAGLYLYNVYTGVRVWQDTIGGAIVPCNQLPPTLSGPLQDTLEWTWHFNQCPAVPHIGPFHPLYAHALFIPQSVLFKKPNNPAAARRINNPVPITELTELELTERAEKILQSDHPDYKTLQDWICSIVTGECNNPRYAYVTTPDCTGQTPADCETQLRDAGYTGTIETTQITEPSWTAPPNTVTATYPYKNTDGITNQKVTIYQNTSTPPAPLNSTEQNLYSNLQTRSDPTIHDDKALKTTGRECLKLLNTAHTKDQTIPADSCETLPIYIPGSEIEEATANQRTGLENNPTWILQHHRTSPPRTEWYNTKPECDKNARNQAGPDHDCDEFPKWSTHEAYDGLLGNYNTHPTVAYPQIALIARSDNRSDGAKQQHFYSKCGVQVSSDTNPTAIYSAFLIIPNPEGSGLETTIIC